ncbi:MAG: hypothetical protein ABI885_21490 [Gammaproteobacteria bacterium]
MKNVFLAGIATTTILTGSVASMASAQAAADAKPCSTAFHRQFDFWIGTWNVTQAGKAAGKNEIKAVLGGCALLESWSGSGGVTGHSLNIYDAARGVWHQTWVDSTGSLLTLEGKFTNGEMVLEGSAAAEAGAAPTLQRITWTPQPNGTVRQLWQSSSNNGGPWKTEFDGIYKRAD